MVRKREKIFFGVGRFPPIYSGGEILRNVDRSDIFARGGFALEGRLGLHVLEDTAEGIVIVDILEYLTAARLQEHPSKHVGLGNQDTVAGRLQEEPDERAFGVDVGVCLLYTSPSPRDRSLSRMPSSA